MKGLLEIGMIVRNPNDNATVFFLFCCCCFFKHFAYSFSHLSTENIENYVFVCSFKPKFCLFSFWMRNVPLFQIFHLLIRSICNLFHQSIDFSTLLSYLFVNETLPPFFDNFFWTSRTQYTVSKWIDRFPRNASVLTQKILKTALISVSHQLQMVVSQDAELR